MSYLVNTPTIKKKFCKHEYRTFFPQGKPIEACKKCKQRKVQEPINTKLTEFVDPAFKQSNIPEGFSEEFYWKYQFMTNWDNINEFGWRLPATGEPHYWCGIFQTIGCVKAKKHAKLGYGNIAWVKKYPRSCFRPVCKICCKKWLGRQANRATQRIEEYIKKNKGEKPFHVFFSPPKEFHNIPFDELKKQVKLIIRKARIKGGPLIFHPFRFDEPSRKWKWSPHFHLVGFGSYRNLSAVFGWKKWYVGNMGFRKSVFHTLHYLLSHCGIKKGVHALTWLGDLSYCKLDVQIEEKCNECPYCKSRLVPIFYAGIDPVVPPDQYFEGFVDADGWYEEKPVIEDNQEYRFDHAPTKDLNEILKGLETAN